MAQGFKTAAAILICGALTAPAAIAQDRQAILLSNRNYERLADVSEARLTLSLTSRLRQEGFEVSDLRDLDSTQLRRALADLQSAVSVGTEVIVVVSGHIVSSQTDSWLLATDAARPSPLMPGDDALSLSALAALMAEDAGSAVLLVGTPATSYGSDLSAGAGKVALPQGVTLFTGPTASVVELVSGPLLTEGLPLAKVAQSARITAQGYLPANQAFLDTETSAPALPDGVSEQDVEDLLFARARDAGTEAALIGFLDRYPTGLNAAEARRLLADLSRSPEDIARAKETALALTRDDKRAIQEDLTLLGFDTRGVDGLFGRGSRNAIAGWQRANGYDATSYVNEAQIALMDAQAKAARQAQEREDAAFWQQTGRLGTEAGYRAYLSRYPNGLFAQIAQAELDVVDQARQEQANAAEQALWAETMRLNTADAYRAFVDRYPNGPFTAEAQARLDAFAEPTVSQMQIDAAKAQEDKAMVNPILRLLAEQRLAAFGFAPGRIDGQFDDSTRNALIAFQEANGVAPTGYLDAQTITLLLNSGG